MIQKLAFVTTCDGAATMARTRPTTRIGGLREIAHRVFLKPARGAHDLETSAVLETGADVQIGGGVRVGDAFKANVESRPIAIWVTIELCRNFSSRALRSCEL